MKPLLYLEKDVFYDETIDYTKYFNVKEIDNHNLLPKYMPVGKYRGSLNLSKRLYWINHKFSNALNWVPHLRELMINPSTIYFNDLGFIRNHLSDDAFPLFIRPEKGDKSFAGSVFPTKDKFIE